MNEVNFKMNILDEFYLVTDSSDKDLFIEIEKHLASLGYKPSRAKTKDINIVFKNRDTKEHLAKYTIEKGKAVLKLKFYSSKSYSALFNEAIRITIEEYEFRYTGCYGCGKCKESLEGYQYEYSDGRKYFRCGKELIALPDVKLENLDEIIQLITTQHEYLLKRKC